MSNRQWFTPNLPLVNTLGIRDVLVLQPQPVATYVDLRTVFGGLDYGGSKLVIRGDGGGIPTGAGLFKAYVAMSNVPNAIDETKLGTASGACWPVVDGESVAGRLLGGREVATGYATLFTPVFLNYKSVSGGTGYLRVMRAADDNVDASIFRMPITPSGYTVPTGGVGGAPSGAWWQG